MSHQIQIAIVEDDFVISRELQISLQNMGYEVLSVCDNGEDFLSDLARQKPDLALLDIQLAGKLDGIELGCTLREKYRIPFIFLTAQSDLSTLERAKFTEPQAYLIKPVNMAALQATIEIALYKLSKHQTQASATPKEEEDKNSFLLNNQLFVKHKNRLEKISLEDILWVEARDIYAIIKTTRNQFVVSQSLKTIESQLGDQFVRVHRSYLIALEKIEAIEDNSLIIAGQYIPIGKTHKNDLLNKLRII